MSEQKRPAMNRMILSVLLIFALCVISGCRSRNPEKEETTAVQTIAETTKAAEETTAVPESRESEDETDPVKVKTDLPDKDNLVGRVIIDDLGLNEYLMQGDEYLELDNDGNYALKGSLYLPGYSTEECIFINGHTMRDGSMFGNLYRQRDHLPGMRIILQSEEEETEFRIVRTYIVSGTDEKAVAALFTGDYKNYLKESWDLEVEGRVLSLMCCEYSLPDGRLFVVAEEWP